MAKAGRQEIYWQGDLAVRMLFLKQPLIYCPRVIYGHLVTRSSKKASISVLLRAAQRNTGLGSTNRSSVGHDQRSL